MAPSLNKLVIMVYLVSANVVFGEKRTDFIIQGTTLSPGFVRKESKGRHFKHFSSNF